MADGGSRIRPAMIQRALEHYRRMPEKKRRSKSKNLKSLGRFHVERVFKKKKKKKKTKPYE